MNINYEEMNEICKNYGDAYYLLDSSQFENNYLELKNEFMKIYPEFNIAYSYKTNYIPKLCKIINKLGGYAEVVSDMEMEIALRIGVTPEKIIWNGPYKNFKKMEELLVMGGTINIDSEYEIDMIKQISKLHPEKILNIGIRCNFDINDGVTSRFGLDIEDKKFKNIIKVLKDISTVCLKGIQCHFATRALENWKPRALKMLNLFDELNMDLEHIDLGGGLFGKMDSSLKAQFDVKIPNYNDYAKEIAIFFADKFKDKEKRPLLLIEPGSALVGDCMNFISKVINIKNIRGKNIATLLGSIYNINPTLNKKNPPIKVLKSKNHLDYYENIDFGGFTCIESDYLYKNYIGEVAVGDIVVFKNIGSYSIVLKPPFILPNFPILEIIDEEVKIIKRQECFEDIFHTFNF